MKTLALVAMVAVVVTGCSDRGALQNPGNATVDFTSEALDGCWTPISSTPAPDVHWVEGSGFSVDDAGAIYVARKPHQPISETSFAEALDTYWQLNVADRPDLTADHVARCEAFLKASGN